MVANKKGEKRISAQTIKSVEASFKAYTDTIPTSVEKSLIEAPVTENFKAATDKVKSSMESLTDTVKSLDVYLNSVADTFIEMDTTISTGIEESLNSWYRDTVGPVKVNPFGNKNIYAESPIDAGTKNMESSKYYRQLPGV